MTDRGVLGMAAGLDRPHHDLARVNSDPRLDRNFALRAQTLGVVTQLLLHRQRRMKCPLWMVLVRHGCTE